MTYAPRRLFLVLVAVGLLLGAGPTGDEASPGPTPGDPVTAGDSIGVDLPPASVTPGQTPARRGGFSALPSGANVAIIPVRGDIYDFVLQSLQRRVQRAVAQGATAIVLEIDTNGGLVTAALDIAKFLKDPNEVPVPTVAWVHPKAYSAGILIASACDQIVMSPSAATGDCAPIVPGRELAATERAKAFSPIATEFKNSAAQGGYTYATFHAMCVLGVELYLIEDPATGERLVVNQEDFKIMVEGDDAGLNTGAAGAAATDAGISAVVPIEATTADVGRWKPIEKLPSGASAPRGRVHDGNTLFTADAVLASDIGLSRATLNSDAAIQQYLGAARVFRVEQSWSENAAGFLSTMWVRVVLVLLLVLGVGLELASPGLGVPAAVALFAAVGLFGAPMVIGLAELWHVLLFAVGLGLVVLEIATLITGGALLAVGMLLMLVALILSAVPSGPGGLPASGTSADLLASAGYTMVALTVSFVGLLVLTHHLGRVPGFDRLVLADAQPTRGAGPVTPLDGEDRLGVNVAVGDRGTVVSTLRPGGTARFGESPDEIDVVSSGGFIDAGKSVVVVQVGRFEVMVEEA